MYELLSTEEQAKAHDTLILAGLKQLSYNENSVDNARTKWQDARETLQKLQSSGNSELMIAARQAEHEAKIVLDDAIQHAGHLAEQKRVREAEAQRNAALEAEQKQTQQEHAAASKANFRAEAKTRWLAAGGSEHSFSEQFESLWTDEVRRRFQQVPSEQSAMTQKLLATGRYQS
jgi:hypothetical protein